VLAEFLCGVEPVQVDLGSLERTPILMEQVTRNIHICLSQMLASPGWSESPSWGPQKWIP